MNQSYESFEDASQRESAAVAPVEALMNRMVDGEASADECARFETMAEREPALWRRLALAHQDMATLSRCLQRELEDVEQVELPEQRTAGLRQRAWRYVVPWSGWAAAAALAIAAIAGIERDDSVNRLNGMYAANTGSNDASTATDSPEEHLREYLDAPYVLGEMPPALLEVQELTDGRYALRILRQFEEVAFVQSADQVPVDEQGNLALAPEDLRTATN